jgi:MFS transporter, DHA2 family, multidrug resistance protein
VTTATREAGAAGSWIIAPVVALAAFMEIMDISIANVSLPHIAGSLSSSQDESTWVLTSYLVTNAAVMPISGWLSARFGRKRFFLVCIAGFTVASLLCGLAPSLAALVALRAAQGAFGGGLQPMGQAILTDSFPPERRGMATAMPRLSGGKLSVRMAWPIGCRPPPSLHRRSARPWAGGSPTVTTGVGSF